MSNESNAYQKLMVGDRLSDDELDLLHAAFEQAFRACAVLGPRFALASDEAATRLTEIERLIDAR